MSMISKLVDTLRTLSGLQNKQHHERIINRAADTIESLSAKLADMERSAEDCGGGWIPCKERLPQKDETVLIDTGIGYFEIATYSGDGKTFYTEECGSSCPVAWQPLPEPYHEP